MYVCMFCQVLANAEEMSCNDKPKAQHHYCITVLFIVRGKAHCYFALTAKALDSPILCKNSAIHYIVQSLLLSHKYLITQTQTAQWLCDGNRGKDLSVSNFPLQRIKFDMNGFSANLHICTHACTQKHTQ